MIIFAEYRDTQRWLYERLLAAGYPARRLALLYGGQDEQDREYVKNVFTADPELDEVRVLIATDAASEGINLQWHCHRVLHWEIPWNPNRLEQRNGRVDRHGQRAPEVQVRHFVPAGWQSASPGAGLFTTGSLEDELDFLRIAVEKVDRIREDLGSAGEVISAQVERKMLGRQAEWLTADAEIDRRATRARLKVKRDLARDLERLTETLAGSRATLDLTPSTRSQGVRPCTGSVVVRAEHPPIVRVPDVVVTKVGGPEDRLAASDVLLAVEIISPGSRNVDLHLKPFEYAEAGIPHYWLVDLDPPAPSITVFHLGAPDDGYVEGPATAGQLVTTVPFDLCIDIPALVAPRS